MVACGARFHRDALSVVTAQRAWWGRQNSRFCVHLVAGLQLCCHRDAGFTATRAASGRKAATSIRNALDPHLRTEPRGLQGAVCCVEIRAPSIRPMASGTTITALGLGGRLRGAVRDCEGRAHGVLTGGLAQALVSEQLA